jgi:hypothetical protein
MASPEELRHRIRARLAEQRMLVGALLRQREQLRGSLFTRYAQCGKEGCVCREGRLHGPYYVLSTRSGGSGGFAYLGRVEARKARLLVARHRDFQEGLRRLRRVNHHLVELLRRYQEAMTRKGGRGLGLAAQA